MSEASSRPAPTRGRTSTRGSRASARPANRRGDRQSNGDHKPAIQLDETDQGELGEMKKKYSSQLSMLKELFPDWTDVDLLFAIQETDGDLDRTIEHITEGNVSQFADVKKKTKERSKPKDKDHSSEHAAPGRGARGRSAVDSARGGRTRTERGRGSARGGRGGSHAATNGGRAAAAPAAMKESAAWDSVAGTSSETPATWDTGSSSWDSAPAKSPPSGLPEASKSSAIQSGPQKKTWASMFATPKPAPVPQKSAPAESAPPAPEPSAARPPASDISSGYVEVTHEDAVDGEGSVSTTTEKLPSSEAPAISEPPAIAVDDSNLDVPPSKDKLTEDNVEHLPDSSHPAPTGTAASTINSSQSRGFDSATPSMLSQVTQQPPIGRPALGGFQTTALKATAPASRSSSFQRRFMEQQQAVVLPGNHAVERTAVQFGSLGLNGDASGVDVDEDREDAETRPQPPQHSPPSQPRASLPPVPRQPAAASEVPIHEVKAAPGLSAVPQQPQVLMQQTSSALGQSITQPTTQTSQQYNPLSRFGQPNLPSESAPTAQKSFDPFAQQTTSQQSPFEGYSSSSQPPTQPSQAAQTQLGGLTSASDYQSFYSSSDQHRNAYPNYYNNYGQHSSAAQQDTSSTQQRAASGFGAGATDSSFPSSQSHQHQANQGRYGDSQQSGHTTPNPLGSHVQPGANTQNQQQHLHQHQHGQGQHAGYPYSHPYYNNNPYYSAYMSQYQYGQQGFGAPTFNKTGMYGQPHHGGFGMNPQQSSYEQHSSPGMGAGTALGGRDAGGLGGAGAGGLSDYARSGSTQPSQAAGAPHHQSSASPAPFGVISDAFSRAGGNNSFPGQNSAPYGAAQAGQQPSQAAAQAGAPTGVSTATDDSTTSGLKPSPYGSAADTKPPAGPSPSALGGVQQQGGRPTSAATSNNTPGAQAPGGLPPPQGQQFGGYPSHFSQYSGLGGALGGGNQHTGYGGYGGFSGSSGYGGSYGGRGGWGASYGHH